MGTRGIAEIDRDQLRAWLHTPYEGLDVDDVRLMLLADDSCLFVDGAGPYVLPDPLVQHLATAI